MLIRSQDKWKLTNIDQVTDIIVTKTINDGAEILACYPYCSTSDCGYATLGTYSTEEKAIKVLDMIQEEYLKCNCQPIIGDYGFVRNSIFQMPQDS